MKICVISYSQNAHAPKRLIEEGRKRGHKMYLAIWEETYLDIQSNKIYFGDKQSKKMNMKI